MFFNEEHESSKYSNNDKENILKVWSRRKRIKLSNNPYLFLNKNALFYIYSIPILYYVYEKKKIHNTQKENI